VSLLRTFLTLWFIGIYSVPHSDFTFVCPTEILAFDAALPDFARINTKVLGTPSLSHDVPLER
jgi:peroxiredoxin (alkyl hydroperoxide reductase subunit C)